MFAYRQTYMGYEIVSLNLTGTVTVKRTDMHLSKIVDLVQRLNASLDLPSLFVKQHIIPKPVHVLSYEERRSQISTLDDIDKQIHLAQKTVMRLNNQLKKQTHLHDKVRYQNAIIRAEKTLHALRNACFDIEDEIKSAAA
jgi:hypothetical protein